MKNLTIHKLDNLPIRRATVPSPRSPLLSLFPTPPSASDGFASQQRAGLSRSNTLPSPVQTKFSEKPFPKRKESHLDAMWSPFHGSETPTSSHSDWQSEGSINVSEVGDGDEEEEEEEENSDNIIIQLGDLAIPHMPPIRPFTNSVSTSMRSSASIPLIYQPSLDSNSHHQSMTDEMDYSTRISSRLQPPSTKYSLMPLGTINNKERSTTAIVKDINPPAPTTQQPLNKPMQRFNPLQSSPATPTEITIARQLSLSRSRTTVVPITKTARQPQLTTIIDPDSFPEPKGWKFSVPSHMRNKSHHVVLESA